MTDVWLTLVPIASALISVTSFVIAFLILRKVWHNHFIEKIWRPLLTSLGLLFLCEGFTHIIHTYHQIVHLNSSSMHAWFALVYLMEVGAELLFYFTLLAQTKTITHQ